MKPPPLRLRGLGLFSALAAYTVALIFVPLRAVEPRTVPDIGLKLMPIPAGSFTMGSPATEAGRGADEGPQTRVTISRAFWLGQTEVTHAQWRAIMGTDLVEQVRRMLADDTLYDITGKRQTFRDFFRKAKDSDPRDLVYNTNDDAPMDWVSWEEAIAFCRGLTERERAAGRLGSGYEYRLPTEAEWEYACRAGTTGATYAGDMEIKGKTNAPVLDAIAWYAGNSSVDYTGKGANTANWVEKQYPGGTAAQRTVGTKQPNGWGLHDMLGNVWEWCGDWYAGKLPGGELRDPIGPASGSQRVSRGGSWSNTPDFCRAAARRGSAAQYRGVSLGFRVALAPRLNP